jgi:hypothetical protein
MKEHEMKLKKHNIHQESCKHLYHTWRTKSNRSKEDFLCVIHDKINHSKTTLPKLQVKKKWMKVGKKEPSNVWKIFKNYFCETLKRCHGNTINLGNAIFFLINFKI